MKQGAFKSVTNQSHWPKSKEYWISEQWGAVVMKQGLLSLSQIKATDQETKDWSSEQWGTVEKERKREIPLFASDWYQNLSFQYVRQNDILLTSDPRGGTKTPRHLWTAPIHPLVSGYWVPAKIFLRKN
jgi:hypothetical protein